MQGLWFLQSACCLMLIDIYMKFSLNGFQVIERTQFSGRQSSKGNNSKKYECKSYGSCALHVV